MQDQIQDQIPVQMEPDIVVTEQQRQATEFFLSMVGQAVMAQTSDVANQTARKTLASVMGAIMMKHNLTELYIESAWFEAIDGIAISMEQSANGLKASIDKPKGDQ